MFKKLFGSSHKPEDDLMSMPWDQRPSIYEHIRTHVDESRPGLIEGGDILPDEERIASGSQIRWAAGAMDGVLGHHAGQGNNDELVRKAVNLVMEYCRSPAVKAKATLYLQIIEANTLPLIDSIIEALVGNESLNHDRLYELAYSFVTEAPDREPVKFGIAILGLYLNPKNVSLFQVLGRHEEFTLFAAVALERISDDPEQALWSLAMNVSGWGRIHIVERLSNTKSSEIRGWMLREGYRNSIMNEYLAYTCATAGGLLSALSDESIDQDLKISAGEILVALIAGGPANGIDDYDDGAQAVARFLQHEDSSAETLSDFVNVHTIKIFLDEENSDWNARAERGWTIEHRNCLRKICDRILSSEKWAGLARTSLLSKDDFEFHLANQVAEALKLPTWDVHWHRLQERPTDSSCWYRVMVRCSVEQIAKVIAFAELHIDLEKIASGPSDELGLGPGWEHHLCLDFILQELHKFPGQGSQLIRTGLRSPIVRNRNKAVAAVAAWDREYWDDELRAELENATKNEPDDSVRKRLNKALRGEPLDD